MIGQQSMGDLHSNNLGTAIPSVSSSSNMFLPAHLHSQPPGS